MRTHQHTEIHQKSPQLLKLTDSSSCDQLPQSSEKWKEEARVRKKNGERGKQDFKSKGDTV